MMTARYRTPCLIALLLAVSFALISCQSRAQSAQALFDKGEFEKVIEKYPDLEIARRAHAKIADKLLIAKKYSEVLNQYADTPAAYKARMQLAQQVFDAGRYQAVIDSFPQSPLAALAKGKLADSLFTAGALDELIKRFPDSDKGKQVKEERAKTDFDKAKKLRGAAKKAALEAIMTQYSGTEIYKEAGTMLSQIREAEAKKAQKKK
jgi:hypothetical protein